MEGLNINLENEEITGEEIAKTNGTMHEHMMCSKEVVESLVEYLNAVMATGERKQEGNTISVSVNDLQKVKEGIEQIGFNIDEAMKRSSLLGNMAEEIGNILEKTIGKIKQAT